MLRDTVRFALRAVRAASDCPGVVQAAADALGGVRAADPESAARETRRFYEEKERDGDGDGDVSPSPSSPSPSHAPLYSSLSVLGDALRAPSRHARHAALAFLCEVSASTGECGETSPPPRFRRGTRRAVSARFCVFSATSTRATPPTPRRAA